MNCNPLNCWVGRLMAGPKVSLNWSDLCSMCSSRKVINFLITFTQITFAYREKRSIVFEGKLLRRKIEKLSTVGDLNTGHLNYGTIFLCWVIVYPIEH